MNAWVETTWATRYGVLFKVAGVVLLLGLLLGMPLFVGSYVLTMFVFILIYSLLTMGLGLLIGWAGQFSLGQGALFGVGAYVSGVLSAKFHVNPWIALVCAAVVTGCVAYVLGKPFLSVPGYKVGFVTLGFSYMMYSIISRVEYVGGHDGFAGIQSFAIGKLILNKDYQFYYLCLVIVGIVLLVNRNFVNSRLGKQAKAIDIFSGGSIVAAESLGIDTGALKTRMFTIAGVYAGIAGSLYAHYMTQIHPAPFDVWGSIIVLLMVIMGGVQSLWGGIVGAATYYLLRELITYVLGEGAPMGWQYLIYGIVVAGILLVFPRGLMGLVSRLWLVILRRFSPAAMRGSRGV